MNILYNWESTTKHGRRKERWIAAWSPPQWTVKFNVSAARGKHQQAGIRGALCYSSGGTLIMWSRYFNVFGNINTIKTDPLQQRWITSSQFQDMKKLTPKLPQHLNFFTITFCELTTLLASLPPQSKRRPSDRALAVAYLQELLREIESAMKQQTSII